MAYIKLVETYASIMEASNSNNITITQYTLYFIVTYLMLPLLLINSVRNFKPWTIKKTIAGIVIIFCNSIVEKKNSIPWIKLNNNISEDIVYPNVIPKTKAIRYNKMLPKKVKPSNQIIITIIMFFIKDCLNTLILEILLSFFNDSIDVFIYSLILLAWASGKLLTNVTPIHIPIINIVKIVMYLLIFEVRCFNTKFLLDNL